MVVSDVLTENINFKEKYDWIYINIGGEETELFIDFIKKHLKSNGNLLVSGLVEWSFEKINAFILDNNFKAIEKYQSNEWVTAIYSL